MCLSRVVDGNAMPLRRSCKRANVVKVSNGCRPCSDTVSPSSCSIGPPGPFALCGRTPTTIVFPHVSHSAGMLYLDQK